MVWLKLKTAAFSLKIVPLVYITSGLFNDVLLWTLSPPQLLLQHVFVATAQVGCCLSDI